MPIFAGQLVQDQQLVCVTSHDSLTQALTLMIEHDFSQLPVVDQEGVPLGIITTASIAKALLHLGAKVEELRVDHAVVKLSAHPAEEDLLYLLDTILKDSAVFVVDANDKLLGIITEYDTTQYFRQRAEDLVLVNEVEDALKLHLQIAYDAQGKESQALREAIDNLSNSLDGIRKKSNASLKALCKAKSIKPTPEELDTIVDKHFPLKEEPRLFEELTLSEFIQLAQKNWLRLEPAFGLAQPAWSKMMDDVRLIRNKLFHFKGDTTAVERHKLKYCANWYTNHPPIASRDERVTASHTDTDLSDTSDRKEVIPEAVVRRTRMLHKTLHSATAVKYKGIAQALDEHVEAEEGGTLTVGLDYLSERVSGGLPQAARESLTWWIRSSFYSPVWILRGWKPINVDHKWVTFLKQTIPDDMAPINLHDPWDASYWRAKLSCTVEHLQEAIQIVGPLPADVLKFLERNESSFAVPA